MLCLSGFRIRIVLADEYIRMEDSVSRITFLSIGKQMCEPEQKDDKPVQATISESMDRSLVPISEHIVRYEIHVCTCAISINR